MPSMRYRGWFGAIRNKRRVCYIYQGKPREGCPHVLGVDKDGAEKVLVCRIVPGGSRPQWRCLFVAETAIAGPARGPWLQGGSHKQRNSCIVDVHIDINRAAEQRFDWTASKKPRPKKTADAKKKKPRTR
ncbi:MAG TPA: hypothetical protein VHC39_13715 [Rhizomicrobium sp.]|nr:hypothetical protein [Rhizomicrobium sp.]